ncbi:hypothetical protein OG948_35565 (plasmid) [Embleya sp. NBC_00888]|uniref:hypothetical protein n=1 Tax=Embleya sp. NBC_00888 TaxID=2975960 RepID=UPI002F9175E8|nr:hypothetical protein OG948_35565 [Embleya sp. NBC_00888]
MLPEEARLFRRVIVDRFPGGVVPGHAQMFFDRSFMEPDPPHYFSFWSDFYNDILHQGSCMPGTADAVPLPVAWAVDDRIPAPRRLDLVDFLARIATVSQRDAARGTIPQHLRDEARARLAVHDHAPQLLVRWGRECVALRIGLAALAAILPHVAATTGIVPRIRELAAGYREGTATAGFLDFAAQLATGPAEAVLTKVEELTAPTADTPWHRANVDASVFDQGVDLVMHMFEAQRLSLHRHRPTGPP